VSHEALNEEMLQSSDELIGRGVILIARERWQLSSREDVRVLFETKRMQRMRKEKRDK